MSGSWSSSLRRTLVAVSTFALLASACAEDAQDDFPTETVVDDGSGSAQAAPEADPDCSEENPGASFAPTDTSLQSTSPDIEQIKSDGKLTVGVAQDTLLFGYLDAASGSIEGFDVEMARLVSTALFGSPDRIELIPIQSSERIPKLQSGELELVVKTMTITCERWAEINFSTVYYDAQQRLLVRTDSGITSIEDFADFPAEEAKICAEEDTTSIANVSEFDYLTPVAVPSVAECLVRFQQTSVAGISTDDTILAGLAAQDPFAVIVGDQISKEPYGLGTSKENVEFTRFVNAVLEQARADGSWQEAYDKWLADTLGPQSPPAATYR